MAPALLPARHSALIRFLWWSGLRAARNDGQGGSRSPLGATRMHWHSRESGLEGRKFQGGLFTNRWDFTGFCALSLKWVLWNVLLWQLLHSHPKLPESWPRCKYCTWHHKFTFPWPAALFPARPSASFLSCLSLYFSSPPAFPVSPIVHLSWVGSLSYIRVHPDVVLMSRPEQEVHFPFQGKITELNLNVFFVLTCPCETIKNCLHILSWFWHLKQLDYKRIF